MTGTERLKELLPLYVHTKSEADDYKKLAESYNKEIKEIMQNEKIAEFKDGKLKVRRIEATQESFNESVLIDILKQHGLEDHVIKTREYVDMDTLESFIYNGTIPQEVVAEFEKAKKVKTVVSLRVSKK